MPIFTKSIHHVVVVFFSIILLILFVGGGYQYKAGIVIETDLQALIPRLESEIIKEVDSRIAEKGEGKIAVLLSSKDKASLFFSASKVRELIKLVSIVEVDEVTSRISETEVINLLERYPYQLLSSNERNRLENNTTNEIADQIKRSLYSVGSLTRLLPVVEDPLNSLASRLGVYINSPNRFFLEDGEIVLDSRGDDKNNYLFLPLVVKASEFDLSVQEKVIKLISDIEGQLNSRGVDVTTSGVIFHAAQAAKKAKSEVRLIAGFSTLGVVILFLIGFRSIFPLLMTLLSLSFACLLAFSVTHFLFGSVHLITLVFGASLVGVSVDYSFHYFCKLFSSDMKEDSFSIFSDVFPSITLGLVTSVVGFSSLMWAGLSGLQQIAVFSVVGLLGAWFFVVAFYPFLTFDKKVVLSECFMRWSKVPGRIGKFLVFSKNGLFFYILVFISLICLFFMAKAANDIRVLYVPPKLLLNNDVFIQNVMKPSSVNQYFVISADSEQKLLENSEDFSTKLDQLTKIGAIEDYQSISNYLPSIKQQKLNYDLFKDLYSSDSALLKMLKGLGFEREKVDLLHINYQQQNNNWLTLYEWEKNVPSELSNLFLGKIDGQYVAIIKLINVSNSIALDEASRLFSNVIYIDKVTQISHVLKTQRQQASLFFVVAVVFIAIVLVLRYRRWRALKLVAIPLFASLFCLTIISVLGVAITIFHIFALFLVLGLGMDYGIFLFESGEDTAVSMAVLLSALTSILSFGLLSLSSTPMIAAFGTIVLIGCIINLLLAPTLAINND